MKTAKLVGLLMAGGLLASKGATTFTVTNFLSGAAQQVQSATGVPLVTGMSVSIGTFADAVNFTGYNQFGSAAFTTNALAPGIFGSVGGLGITGNLSNVGSPDDAFVDQSIFVRVNNPNDAGQFIVWNSGKVFVRESSLDAGAAVTIQTMNSPASLVKGFLINNGATGFTGSLATANNGISEAVTFVPEPSAALLGALGALGLLRRRRN